MNTITNIKDVDLHFNSNVDSGPEIKEKVFTAYEKNKLFFGFTPTKKCEVYILYKREEMDKVCGNIKTEPWLVGTTTSEGVIYIFSPTVFEKLSCHPSSNFDPILTHELAHVFTNEIIKTNRPTWLNEGLAGYIAEQCKSKRIKRIEDFKKLHNRKDWNKGPNYTQACQFTTFLIKKFGKPKLLKFLKNIPENDGSTESFFVFSKFFKTFFNINFNTVVKEWKKEMLLRNESE